MSRGYDDVIKELCGVVAILHVILLIMSVFILLIALALGIPRSPLGVFITALLVIAVIVLVINYGRCRKLLTLIRVEAG